jgi:hypothetical protein
VIIQFTPLVLFKIIFDSALGPKDQSLHILFNESVMSTHCGMPKDFVRISSGNLSYVSLARLSCIPLTLKQHTPAAG